MLHFRKSMMLAFPETKEVFISNKRYLIPLSVFPNGGIIV
jgi:hypothetical protein